MPLGLINSIINKYHWKEIILVNAPAAIIEEHRHSNIGFGPAVLAVGKTGSREAGSEDIVKNLFEVNPRMQAGMVFLRYEEARQSRPRFLQLAGIARANGFRPVLNLGTLPGASELYSSILYRRPLAVSPGLSAGLKQCLNRIAVEVLGKFFSHYGDAESVSLKTG